MNLFTRDLSFRDTLQNLRYGMMRRSAWVCLLFFLIALYLALFNHRFPANLAILLGVMSMGVWGILRLLPRRPDLARYSFILLLNIGLLTAMALTRDPWLPLLGIALMVVAAMTVTYGHWTSAVSIGLGAYAFMPDDYALGWLVALIALTVFMLQTSVASLYTALAWYRAMQERADKLLDESREHQAKLTQTLKSLDLAYQNLNRTQNQLITARQQADEARRLKQRFAANISHELRTPLNLIVGFSEVMVMMPEIYTDTRLPPKLAHDLYQIYTSSRHLLEMVDDVLDLSQAELSSFSLDIEHTDIAHFIEDSAEVFRNIFRDGRLSFSIDLAPNLPHIEMDKTRTRQILINLLSNAHRFTDTGVVLLKVWQDERDMLFSVTDTGRGIPPDKHAQIFEEFYQVDSSLSRKHGGAGLGLAISKRFVETQNGRIWVESDIGQGATFTFSLPLRLYAEGVGRSASDTGNLPLR
jgi:signal transduction histidine kinase